MQGGPNVYSRGCKIEICRWQRQTPDAVSGRYLDQSGPDIVYSTASNTILWQLDGNCNNGIRLALGVFSTSPVSSMHTGASFEQRCLKMSLNHHLLTDSCMGNSKSDQITRVLGDLRSNRRGRMTWPLSWLTGLKVETALASPKPMMIWFAPWGHTTFPRVHTNAVWRDTL